MDFDPAPLFALSLLPYLLFLRWLKRSETLPELALWGFRLTLLFVLITIVAAVLALRCCDAELWRWMPCMGERKPFSPWPMPFW